MLMFSLRSTSRNNLPVPGNRLFWYNENIEGGGLHRVTDYYGPIVYTNFADPKGEYLPDSQEKDTMSFFLNWIRQ